MQISKAMVVSVFLSMVVVSPLSAAGIYCFDKAGRDYNISPALLSAISYVESSHNANAINHNTNGSVDYGHMQINSCWKKSLSSRWKYLSDPCYCTLVGAWILRQCINRYGYRWNAVACYHMGRVPSEHESRKRQEAVNYIQKVQHALNLK